MFQRVPLALNPGFGLILALRRDQIRNPGAKLLFQILVGHTRVLDRIMQKCRCQYLLIVRQHRRNQRRLQRMNDIRNSGSLPVCALMRLFCEFCRSVNHGCSSVYIAYTV